MLAYELHIGVKDYCFGRDDQLIGVSVMQLKDIMDQVQSSSSPRRPEANPPLPGLLRLLAVARPEGEHGRDRLDHPQDPQPAHDGRGGQGVCEAEVRDDGQPLVTAVAAILCNQRGLGGLVPHKLSCDSHGRNTFGRPGFPYLLYTIIVTLL